jgi:hypothetical protein
MKCFYKYYNHNKFVTFLKIQFWALRLWIFLIHMLRTDYSHISAIDNSNWETFLRPCTQKSLYTNHFRTHWSVRKPFPNGHKEETHFFFDPLIAQLLKCSEFLSLVAPPCPFFSNNKEGIEKKSKHCVNVYSDSSYFYKSANMYYIGKIF